MKKLIRIVIAAQMVLMLTNCVASTDELYREYTACRDQTLHPKITEAGLVMVHRDGTPIMVYETGACPDEMAKWENAHAMREKRRREREAYQAALDTCTDGTALVCSGHGATSCLSKTGRLDSRCVCSCMDPRQVFKRIW